VDSKVRELLRTYEKTGHKEDLDRLYSAQVRAGYAIRDVKKDPRVGDCVETPAVEAMRRVTNISAEGEIQTELSKTKVEKWYPRDRLVNLKEWFNILDIRKIVVRNYGYPKYVEAK